MLVGPSERLIARGTIKVSSVLLGLVRALRVDEIAAVLVGILRDAKPEGDGTGFGSGDGSRVDAALGVFHKLSQEARRSLVIEVEAAIGGLAWPRQQRAKASAGGYCARL